MSRLRLSVAAFVFCLALPTFGQSTSPAQQRTERAFAAAKKAGAPALYAFLKPFPKGADLHMHFSGAVYAETFIREAAKQGHICVDRLRYTFFPDNPGSGSQTICPVNSSPAADILADQSAYDKLIDSFSLRSFVPSAGYSGHDQFFDTFSRFGGIDKSYQGEWLDELATRAAAQNEQYLEIMTTPSFSHVFPAIAKAPWPSHLSEANHLDALAKYRDDLFAAGLREDVSIDHTELIDVEAQRAKREGCDDHTVDDIIARTGNRVVYAYGGTCELRVHWLYQVLRGFPPAQVFAQTLLGFELASQHPDQVVGINFVRAEDRRDAMAEYHTEMLMLDYLHSAYPKVHISLHAGELAPGLVPPDGLSFHIREAVELGHAERVGHGVDVLYEDRPQELLKEMAAKHIDVEINLVSNEGILGVTGDRHPLRSYMAARVPFSLSTDDEGVSRTDLTHNYVQAVLDQGLTYADLKQSARASLEHSFLPGASLWTSVDNFSHRTAACAGPISAGSLPPGPCKAFLATSEKATQQWELERRFAAFESVQH